MEQKEFYLAKLNYEVDSWDLYEALQYKRNFVVIDVRTEAAFMEEHIPGAINLPHRSMDSNTLSSLKKDSVYVTYCDGIGCNASTKGALKLASYNFKVRELIGGLGWWRRDGYETNGKNAQSGKKLECGCD